MVMVVMMVMLLLLLLMAMIMVMMIMVMVMMMLCCVGDSCVAHPSLTHERRSHKPISGWSPQLPIWITHHPRCRLPNMQREWWACSA